MAKRNPLEILSIRVAPDRLRRIRACVPGLNERRPEGAPEWAASDAARLSLEVGIEELERRAGILPSGPEAA